VTATMTVDGAAVTAADFAVARVEAPDEAAEAYLPVAEAEPEPEADLVEAPEEEAPVEEAPELDAEDEAEATVTPACLHVSEKELRAAFVSEPHAVLIMPGILEFLQMDSTLEGSSRVIRASSRQGGGIAAVAS